MSHADKSLFCKYIVERVDNMDRPGHKHHGCDYFVLDLTHDKHAVPAIQAYVESCRDEYPALAADLDKKLAEMKGGSA